MQGKRADFLAEPAEIYVLAYSSGQTAQLDHLELLRRNIDSILSNSARKKFHLTVGLNNPSPRIRQYLRTLSSVTSLRVLEGVQQRDLKGNAAYPKYPLMRRMLRSNHAAWNIWFDDDSYVTSDHWLEALEQQINLYPDCHQFGKCADVPHMHPQPGWVEGGSWYRGNIKLDTKYLEDGSIRVQLPYIVGGFYCLSRAAICVCDIPDSRLFHNGGDWTTGLALHFNGFKILHHTHGIAINAEPRRGIHKDELLPPGEAAKLQQAHLTHDASAGRGKRWAASYAEQC